MIIEMETFLDMFKAALDSGRLEFRHNEPTENTDGHGILIYIDGEYVDESEYDHD